MLRNVYSVYDEKAKLYLQPFHQVNAETAIRSFRTAVQDPQHDFNRYAEDYTLFELGAYDEATGQYMNHETPRSLGKALEFRTPIVEEVPQINNTPKERA